MKTMNEVFSENLRTVLYLTGKTQVELAKGVGVTETSVSHWINGVSMPRPNMVDKICRFLRCRKEDLVLDKTQTAVFAPVDVLAEEMTKHPELYDIFNAILKMKGTDLELLSAIVKRLEL